MKVRKRQAFTAATSSMAGGWLKQLAAVNNQP